MGHFKLDPLELTPPYASLDEANKEVRRLQEALYSERSMYWHKIEKLMFDIRALKGVIRVLTSKKNDDSSKEQ